MANMRPNVKLAKKPSAQPDTNGGRGDERGAADRLNPLTRSGFLRAPV